MNLALIVLRLVVGLLFAGHGAQKLFGSLGGAGLDATAENFDRMGLRPGGFHARAAGMAELLGGSLLALGLFTPFAALMIVAVMTAAVMTVHGKNGVWNTEGGFEFNLVLIAVAFAVTGIGPGDWSLDSAFGLDLAGAGWAIIALCFGIAGGIGAVEQGRNYRPKPAPQGRRGAAHPAS
jgi:putative oxidoreductase